MKKIVNSLKELDNHEFIFENTLSLTPKLDKTGKVIVKK